MNRPPRPIGLLRPGQQKSLSAVRSTGRQAPLLTGRCVFPDPVEAGAKIQALEFMDMSELLPDNIELQRRDDGNTRADTQACGVGNRRPRQVTSLLSWVHCFATYAAVVGDKYRRRVQGLLAYQRLTRHSAMGRRLKALRQRIQEGRRSQPATRLESATGVAF